MTTNQEDDAFSSSTTRAAVAVAVVMLSTLWVAYQLYISKSKQGGYHTVQLVRFLAVSVLR